MLGEMSNEALDQLDERARSGEIIFLECVKEFGSTRLGSIVQLILIVPCGWDGNSRFVTYLKAGAIYNDGATPSTFALAPQATKTWTPRHPRPVEPEVEVVAPTVLDGLGQPLAIGEVIYMIHNGVMTYARYDSYKGHTTLNFTNVQTGEKFRRMPDGLSAQYRTISFRQGLKIQDPKVLELLMVQKLSKP